MWQYQNTDELYHHGVSGMKWGIRRYQNKDGSLTPAGRRRANKLLKEYSKVTGKKVVIKKNTVRANYKKKTINEMTNEELDTLIRRKEKENRYKQLYPEQVSNGKKFINSFKNDIVLPGIKEGSKEGLKNIVANIIKDMGNSALKKSTTNKK